MGNRQVGAFMREKVKKFLDHIAFELGLADNTLEAYATDLERFVFFLERRTKIGDFAQVTRNHILAFLEEQRCQGLRDATRARRLVAIKVLFAYLCAEGLIPSDITQVMPALAKGRVLPRTLSEADITRLLDSIAGDSFYGVRDRCMLEVLYGCGVRVSELVTLAVADIRFEERIIRCRGKGDKQRVIPLGDAAILWLRQYLTHARVRFLRGNMAETHLFLTRQGGPFTRQGVFYMLVRRAHLAQIGVALSPHVLRHCFASHLLAHGANVRAIQEMLGHADIATTQHYTHVDEGHMTRTHAKFHPRA